MSTMWAVKQRALIGQSDSLHKKWDENDQNPNKLENICKMKQPINVMLLLGAYTDKWGWSWFPGQNQRRRDSNKTI